jgi:hypothetical protein
MGLNYAMTPGHIPVKEFLCHVENAIGTLPEETAEEYRQETVRILKGSLHPKDSLTGDERRALQSLKASDLLTILLADKGNAAMVLGTSDYKQKITTLLQKTRPMRSLKGSHGIHRAQDCSPPEEVLVC